MAATKEKKSTPTETMSPEERYHMLQVAAYYRAENNGFAGHPDNYWLDAESSLVPPAIKKAISAKKDKLTLIEGIGPKISDLLIADGIETFADLATATIETLSTILSKAGARYTMHKPDTWPQQAALARDGKMDELKTLQAQLDGGKVK